MAKDQLQGPSSESLDAGYEASGVNVRALAWFVVGLAITAIVVHVGVWYLLVGYERQEEKHERAASALQVLEQPAPPRPRLQPNPFDNDPHANPPVDLQKMYADEDAKFRQMGWAVDEKTHELTIPPQYVEQVIQQEANRTDEPPPPASQPTDRAAGGAGQAGGGQAR